MSTTQKQATEIPWTPGPYKLLVDEDTGRIAISMASHIENPAQYYPQHFCEYMVDTLYPEDGKQWDEAVANAKLFAAATDLAEIVRRGIEANCFDIHLMADAKAALAKARGKA